MSTGASRVNCATFSKIAITENDPAPPSPTVFDTQNRLCTTAVNQTLAYNLVNTSNGVKTLRIWTMDSDGNISIIPEMQMMNLDSAAPALAFLGACGEHQLQLHSRNHGTCEEGFDVNIAGSGVLTPQIVLLCAGRNVRWSYHSHSTARKQNGYSLANGWRR